MRHGPSSAVPHTRLFTSTIAKDERLLVAIKEFDASLTCQGYDADLPPNSGLRSRSAIAEKHLLCMWLSLMRVSDGCNSAIVVARVNTAFPLFLVAKAKTKSTMS